MNAHKNNSMSIQHHPSEALLIDYAAGAMGPAQSMVLATHLHACAECRAQIRAAEAVGGALLEDIATTSMAADALDRALAAIDRPEPEQPSPQPARAQVPQPADWIAVPPEVAEAASRKRWVAPGVWVAPVDTGAKDGPLSYLLRVGKRMRMPQHTHAGSELTVILKGAFVDGRVRFGPGDLAEVDDDVEHSPVILDDGECVCLVACDNPLIVKDWLGRIVQSYAGI